MDMSGRWVIWYDDESSFSWLDGQPWDAPREGVICIAQAAIDCGRFILQETNFYCWHFEDAQWVPHDTLGMHDYLRKPGKEKVVLRGYWVPRERFANIRTRAKKLDDRLPAQTAERDIRPKEE